ncbi:MAG: hypothetical protein JNK48_11630 [Bryobacterales bacterium]|nr:hypothetical protein [Bryobacterales bacterium]
MLSRRAALGVLSSASAQAWQSFYTGKDVAQDKPLELRAGELTMLFEPELGFLRYLRYNGKEVIRGIYAAVRDENWGTVTPRLSNLKLESAASSFRLTFDVACSQAPIDFFWRGSISGDATGSVTFRMEGEARSTFRRNRIGFCVLHPIEGCAGQPCTVVHSGNVRETGKFPLAISPHQPFKDLTAISHTVEPGVKADVLFEGETFEMEDHRNWTDANYKTYCTPLEKPYPVQVPQGARIVQAVTVKLTGAAAPSIPRFRPRRLEHTLRIQPAAANPVPGIGLGATGDVLTWREANRILALKPAHLRVDSRRPEQLRQALALRLPIELAVHLDANPAEELKALRQTLGEAKFARLLIYHAKEKSTNAKWAALAKTYFPAASVGAGANAYFTELNRERPATAPLDFLCYSINPQVHAFDNASLVENLAAQAATVESARLFAGGKPLAVTPVTFKPRFNPNATSAEPAPPAGMPPSAVDPRQMSLFGAAWPLGRLNYLAEAGAASITYYETAGAQGVLERDAGTPWPKAFPSAAGQVFPLYHVIADVLEFSGGSVLRSKSSSPLELDCLVLRKAAQTRVIVANMTAETQAVRFAWPGADARILVRKLDEHTLRKAVATPEDYRRAKATEIALASPNVELSLAPYAVATLESWKV